MLKNSKAVSFSGRSMIDNQLVATFSANIYDTSEFRNDNDNISMVVTDSTLYEANKEAVRKDLQDFQNIVWAEQDKATKAEDEATKTENETTKVDQDKDTKTADETTKVEQDETAKVDQGGVNKADQGETTKADQGEATKTDDKATK